MKNHHPRFVAALFVCLGLAPFAYGQDLRIVTYNIEADINGYTTARQGLSDVLEAIGTQSVAGVNQPIDILALEETTSNTTTVDPIVSSLNTYYASIGSTAAYARSTYQAKEVNNNPSSGNGPNALIYNSSTLTLLASVGLGVPANVSREPVRYEFCPVGGTPAEDFYVYVSHYKSGTATSGSPTNAAKRQTEAALIRTDEATLPADARVVYVGDFNTSSANDLFANLMASGQGQAFDPLTGTATPSGAFYAPVSAYSDSSTSLHYRDDDEVVTQNVLNDAAGLQYISGTYRSFGNNGTTGSGKSTNLTTNTSLSNLTGPFASQQSTILAELTTASDHLPTVADYSLPLLGDANLDGKVDGRDFRIMDAFYLTGGGTATWRNGDFNGDGVVDYLDYAIAIASLQSQPHTALADQLTGLYASAFGSDFTAALAADTPEPGTLLLSGLAASAFLFRRSRRPRA